MFIFFVGAYGALLGAGIPIAQAIRKKNDPVAWMWGGFAAGTVFALKSKIKLPPEIYVIEINITEETCLFYCKLKPRAV